MTIRPPEAIAAGAGWRRVGTVKWFKSGASEVLRVGEYEIQFRTAYPTRLWRFPTRLKRKVSVLRGRTTQVEAVYVRIGRLTAVLAPPPARPEKSYWRIAGTRKWYKLGYVARNVAVGEYEVEFHCPKVPPKARPRVRVRVEQGKLAKALGRYRCKQF